MNQTNSGNLAKMTIECYVDNTYARQEGEPFEVMFNPDKYSLKYEIEYGQRQASGTSANAPSFSNMKSQELTMEFFLDGTGVAAGRAPDVKEKVNEFLDKCYKYDGRIHSNRYLRLVWSSLIFDCVLVSADINYNLFHSSGEPLRAKINAKFTGFVNDKLRKRWESATSPDLSHLRTVNGKERIDTMTFHIYNTPGYYIDVAGANGLINFRKLKAGDRLVFPPLVKEQSP